jgi:hypothetical protein
MRTIRLALALALCLHLSGCFFIFIPGSLIREMTKDRPAPTAPAPVPPP